MPETVNPKPMALVVDDEPSICETLCSILEDESISACRAFDGAEALEKIKEFSPDIVFLDIWMPGWDGIETLEHIKRLRPETEVIMISGHATIANALEATKRGAFDFIEKPLDLETVILSANRALEHRNQGSDSAMRAESDAVEEFESLVDRHEVPPLLTHNGVLSTGLKGRDVGQRTISRSAILYGRCLHSGQKSGLVLEPLPPNTGIHFAKIGDARPVPAFVDYVHSTSFATTISAGHGGGVSTIEHLLSTLHAYKISNLLIKCNDEVPIFDGSAAEFCRVIEEVGIEEQEGSWYEIAVDRPVMVTGQHSGDEPDEVVFFEPSDSPGLTVSYELDYPAPVGRQQYEFSLTDAESFRREIAPARTFGFMKDIEQLQRAGLAAGGRLDNFILIGPDRIVNTELRFKEELVRHKILDAIGDLFLLGRPLCGKVRAKMTGHSDNIRLVSELKELIQGE